MAQLATSNENVVLTSLCLSYKPIGGANQPTASIVEDWSKGEKKVPNDKAVLGTVFLEPAVLIRLVSIGSRKNCSS